MISFSINVNIDYKTTNIYLRVVPILIKTTVFARLGLPGPLREIYSIRGRYQEL